MSYFNVEFAMPGNEGWDTGSQQPSGDLSVLMRQAGDMLVINRLSEAIDILERAAQEHPSSVPLYHMLTKAYVKAKRIADAKRGLDRLRELGVTDPMPCVSLAATALGTRHFDDAIHYFREAERLGAEPGEWKVLLGNALYRTGQLREAEEVYQDVLPLCDFGRYDVFFGLAAIRLQEGRNREALELALHAMQARQAKTRVMYYIGLASIRLGEKEKALKMFERFKLKEPKYVAPYRWLERITREQGNDAEADGYNLKAREQLEQRRISRQEKLKQAAK